MAYQILPSSGLLLDTSAKATCGCPSSSCEPRYTGVCITHRFAWMDSRALERVHITVVTLRVMCSASLQHAVEET